MVRLAISRFNRNHEQKINKESLLPVTKVVLFNNIYVSFYNSDLLGTFRIQTT